MKVALFCVFRNETLYVNEYIDHYLKLGFDHIYLCDNSSNDDVDKILKNEYNDKVTIIDIRSKETIKSFNTYYHPTLFTSLYNIFNFKYDWLCFFDLDEYLILYKDNNIKEYLSRDIFNNVDLIHVYWKVFDDNNQLYYENKSCVERFTHVSNKYYENFGDYANGVKSIVRSGLHLCFNNSHTPKSNNDSPLITVDNDGNIGNGFWCTYKYATYNLASLNHYLTKSAEEYLNKNIHGQWNFYEKYFQINEYSEEKHNMLKSLLEE